MALHTNDAHIDDAHTELEETRTSTGGYGPRTHSLGLTIVGHPDRRRIGESTLLTGLARGRTATLSRLEPSFGAPFSETLEPLHETHLSRSPIHLVPVAEGSLRIERGDSRTRLTVDGIKLDDQRTLDAADLEHGVTLVLSRRVTLLLHWIDPPMVETSPLGLVGHAGSMALLRQQIIQVARLDIPVLLRGETGTGKELAAGAIHRQSSRREGPYVTVNMGAIPPSLAAAELFGAHRGAYTGADRSREGYFQRAEGGTLFLDEIGETSAEVQAMLLRALENHEIQPVGSVEPRRIDVRILAATDSDLEGAIESGNFRAPLLHRLAGYEIRLPPLRERRGDCGLLLSHFLERELEPLGSSLEQASRDRIWPPAEIMARLARFHWPGNVRQLRNVARRLAIAHALDSEESLNSLLDDILGTETERPSDSTPEVPTARRLPSAKKKYRKPSEVDDDELLSALVEHQWRLGPTAKALGVSRTTLYRLIDDSPSIRKASDLDAHDITQVLETTQGDIPRAAAELRVSVQGLKRRMTDLGLP